MKTNHVDEGTLEDPLAGLERQFIAAYLAQAGFDYHALVTRQDEAARRLLAKAALYASERLSEIQARAHFVDELHDRS
jgi:hypothetical protein